MAINHDMTRLDANETSFFLRQLEFIDTKVYEQKFEALIAKSLVPLESGIPDWAKVHTWREHSSTGGASWIANSGDDLVSADTYAAEFTRNIRALGGSYKYDLQEIKAAAATGVPLEQQRALACRRAIETGIDRVLAYGNPARGMEGLLTLTNTTTITPSTKAAGGTTWGTLASPNATGLEMAMDIVQMATSLVVATKQNWDRFDIVIPLQQWTVASMTPVSALAPTVSALQYAQAAAGPMIASITPWLRATASGSTPFHDAGSPNPADALASDLMIAYPKDPEVLFGVVPMPFTPMAPQQIGFNFKVNAMASVGGVVCRYPVAVGYCAGI